MWRGIIEEYRARMPVSAATPVVTMGEGGTPLVPAAFLSARTGCDVYLKVEGDNPNIPRDPDRLLNTSPDDPDRPMVNNDDHKEKRLRFVPSGLGNEILLDAYVLEGRPPIAEDILHDPLTERLGYDRPAVGDAELSGHELPLGVGGLRRALRRRAVVVGLGRGLVRRAVRGVGRSASPPRAPTDHRRSRSIRSRSCRLLPGVPRLE